MRHKLCRSFHPWCPGVKNRCVCPIYGESHLASQKNNQRTPQFVCDFKAKKAAFSKQNHKMKKVTDLKQVAK